MNQENLHARAWRILRRDGPLMLITKGGRFLMTKGSQFLTTNIISTLFGTPSDKIGVYNGVPVRNLPILASTDVHPTHEKQLIEGIRTHTNPGDEVVVVGGGTGPSTVVSARQVGATGTVVAFEGVSSLVDIIKDTIRLNKVSDRVSVRHAIVGDSKSLGGPPDDPSRVLPEEVPQCDVLILDCEGSERSILDGMEIQPRIVVVETHGHFGSPTEEVVDLLERRGYEIKACRQRSETIDIIIARY